MWNQYTTKTASERLGKLFVVESLGPKVWMTMVNRSLCYMDIQKTQRSICIHRCLHGHSEFQTA